MFVMRASIQIKLLLHLDCCVSVIVHIVLDLFIVHPVVCYARRSACLGSFPAMTAVVLVPLPLSHAIRCIPGRHLLVWHWLDILSCCLVCGAAPCLPRISMAQTHQGCDQEFVTALNLTPCVLCHSPSKGGPRGVEGVTCCE